MNLLEELKDKKYAIIASNGYFSYENGIKPLINKINEDKEYFKGLIVADKIVGKASAMLLSLSKAKQVYCVVLSKSGKQILDKYGIECHYDNLVEYIINRKGNDMCPMEKTVKDIDDLDEAYKALNDKLSSLNI